MQFSELLQALFRWLHVFAGIIWIGHLYFFNWVNGPLQAKLDGPTKKAVASVVLRNPFAGRFVEDLAPLVAMGAEVGKLLAERAIAHRLRVAAAVLRHPDPQTRAALTEALDEGAGEILKLCGRALIFGDKATTQLYAHNPAIQIHGPAAPPNDFRFDP